MNDKIVPITFVNDNMVKDNSLNRSMLYPYITEIVSESTLHSMMNGSAKDTGWNLDLLKDSVNTDVISNYVSTNITDIFISAVYKFSEDFFGNDNPKYSIKINMDLIDSIRGKIKSIIYNILSHRLFSPYSDSKLDYNEFISVMNTCSLSILSYLYNVLDNMIQNNCIVHLNSFNKAEFYKYIYTICYGKEPEEIPSDQAKYVLCSSILREASEEYLKYINTGIQEVTYNALCMRSYYINLAKNNYDVKNTSMENDSIKNYRKFIDLR